MINSYTTSAFLMLAILLAGAGQIFNTQAQPEKFEKKEISPTPISESNLLQALPTNTGNERSTLLVF
jgi:hypothetical protein